MATQGSHNGALQNFPFFITVVPVSFACIFIQNKFNIQKLMLMKEHLYYGMSVKFNKFLKNNPENIEILDSAGIISNDVNWQRCELPRSSFEYRYTFIMIM